MSGHTEKCKLGQRRLIKRYKWFDVARGHIVFFENIVYEQVYSEKEKHNIFGSTNGTRYHWKTTKKWPLDIFEAKHGKFKPELVKDHGK